MTRKTWGASGEVLLKQREPLPTELPDYRAEKDSNAFKAIPRASVLRKRNLGLGSSHWHPAGCPRKPIPSELPEQDLGTPLRLPRCSTLHPDTSKSRSDASVIPSTTSRSPQLDSGLKAPVFCCSSVRWRGAGRGVRPHWNAWSSTLQRAANQKNIQSLWAETETEEKKVQIILKTRFFPAPLIFSLFHMKHLFQGTELLRRLTLILGGFHS